MSGLRWWLAWTCLMAALLVCADVSAHAVMVKAAPAQDAVLSKSPPAVSVWFNEALEAAFSSVTVSDSEARVVAQGKLEALSDNGLKLALAEPLPAGTYTVRYRVLSVDGHIVEGHTQFVIEAGAGR